MLTSTVRTFTKPSPVKPELRDLGRITMNVAAGGIGRPIVFIHGLGWDHSLWGSAMTRLVDRYRIIAGDIRGHGATDKPEGPYSVAEFAADWAALIEALADERACVIGFSLGGMIAQQLALDRPDLVGALILVNTSCRSPSTGRAHMRERLGTLAEHGPEAAAAMAAASVFSAGWRAANASQLADFVEWRISQDQAGLARAMAAASNFNLQDRVGSIAAPTLIVTASGDELMLPSDQALLASSIPRAEYAEIADSGHMVPIEQPEAFEAVIEDFLRRHWRPAERRQSGGGTETMRGARRR